MSTPKYIESPNTVQTSLYGYDRHKKVQLNNLRGNPIVVLRSDTVNSGSERGFSAGGPGPKSPRKWVDRSNQIPAPKPSLYPSYAHFHHQYTCPKPTNASAPPSLLPAGPPIPFTHTAHDRTPPRRFPPVHPLTLPRGEPTSPKMTVEDEMTVRRLFDKLAVTTPPPTSSSSSSFSNVSSDITLLELNPKIGGKSFVTTPVSVFAPTSETTSSTPSPCPDELSFLDSPPSSLSEARTVSCCSDSFSSVSVDADVESGASMCEEVKDKARIHTCPDEQQCLIFRSGRCANDAEERMSVLHWYNDLIQWRHDVVTKRVFGPPRCPPAPLTVTIIGASRAQRANPFHRIGEVHPFAMEAMDHVRKKMDARRAHRLIPVDLPLPPPHEFIANAKCLEPHLFVEYCYQLTAAAYVDSGLNPPNRRPPIPPRIEPQPDQTCRESVCSSASEMSSDGEYSDDSDDTKKERLRMKMERHTKRERRLQQLFRRRQTLDEIDEEEDY
ncbi:unnamed protein product [Caenorhabditis sp. 36 PRJEB53466]|nr:unnamed protein product [Caenorhabditis sp. 36 PRJEB53466]